MNNKQIIGFTKDIYKEEGTIVAWANRPTKDRSSERIRWDAWDTSAFEENPVILAFHNYREAAVGKALWVKKTKDGLLFKAEWADTEKGREMRYLYENGFMKAFSVGFIPKEVANDEESKEYMSDYSNVELLEISCVPVPDNRESLLAEFSTGKIKAVRPIIEKALIKETEDSFLIGEETDDSIGVSLGVEAQHGEDGIKGYKFSKTKFDRESAYTWKEKNSDTINLTFSIVEASIKRFIKEDKEPKIDITAKVKEFLEDQEKKIDLKLRGKC